MDAKELKKRTKEFSKELVILTLIGAKETFNFSHFPCLPREPRLSPGRQEFTLNFSSLTLQ